MERNILILADPDGNAWDFAKKIYEKLNSNEKKINNYWLREVEIKKFNDGEIFTKIKESIRKKECYFIHDSSMPPQDWLVSLALTKDSLIRSSAKEINFVLPYMRYSRQDRMTEPGTPITTSVVAEIIQGGNERIPIRTITTDLHNPAVQGSYKIFDNLKAYPVIIKYLKENYPDFLENAILFSPDVGSVQRAKSYTKRLNLDIAIADKTRAQAGIIKEMKIIGDVKDKNILQVEDLVDTAKTLCTGTEILKEKGAKKIWATATHGLFSAEAKDRIEKSQLEKVIITDSIPQKGDGKIEVVSLVDLFAETIFRISHGMSVSELFR